MMRLAPSMGRGQAHDLIHELVEEASDTEKSIRALLKENPVISNHLSQEEIDETLAAQNDIGQCCEIAKAAALFGRQVLD